MDGMEAGGALAIELRFEGSLVAEPFEDVFRRLLPRAVKVARRILNNETRAEDAAAEAFARAHASWHKVGSKPYFEAWILRVTANVAVDMSRRDRHMISSGLDHEEPQNHPDESEIALSRLDIASALASLPKRQREVIILQYLEGFSEQEIAAALGVSAGTVKKNGFRAREKLRDTLGDDAELA